MNIMRQSNFNNNISYNRHVHTRARAHMHTHAQNVYKIGINFYRFLEIVRNGIPDYNTKFNSKKVRSNVGMFYIGRSMKIHFLKQISITL